MPDLHDDARVISASLSPNAPFRESNQVNQATANDLYKRVASHFPPDPKNFNQEETKECFEGIISQIMKLREAGQKEYANGPSFGNFNRLALRLKIPRSKVLWTYASKHLDGIESWMNGHKSQRESVHGRIQDFIVYLMLLDAMIKEDEFNNQDRSTVQVEKF